MVKSWDTWVSFAADLLGVTFIKDTQGSFKKQEQMMFIPIIILARAVQRVSSRNHTLSFVKLQRNQIKSKSIQKKAGLTLISHCTNNLYNHNHHQQNNLTARVARTLGV